jgi:hypothetical protein
MPVLGNSFPFSLHETFTRRPGAVLNPRWCGLVTGNSLIATLIVLARRHQRSNDFQRKFDETLRRLLPT